MKKLLFLFCSLSAILAFVLTACGSTFATIYGIRACINLPETYEKYGLYDETLADKTTLAENDFILEVGKTYILYVNYEAGRGSRYPIMYAKDLVLKYDTDLFDIEEEVYDNDDSAPLKYYNLTCKQAVKYTSIIIEANEQYTYTVIISVN
jgi:hypothetical protein